MRHSLLILLIALSTSACASMETSAGLALPVVSQYVWRGAVVDDRPVIQPDLYWCAESEQQSVTVGVWSNVPTDAASGDDWNFTEVDPYIDYGRQVGPFWLSLGLSNYNYPHQGSDSTAEVHATLTRDFGWAAASFEAWYDFVEAEGAYFNLNLARGFSDVRGWQIDLVSGVGYMAEGQAEYNFGIAESGFSDFLAQASFTRSLSEHLGLTLTGAFASVLDPDLRDAVEDPDVLWVSAGISVEY